MTRKDTKVIQIGDRVIGGGNPVLIQSMCNTKTEDVRATVAQIRGLERAGCDIIRVAVPTMEAASALADIKKEIHIPLVADIHFDYRLAIAAWRTGRTKSVSIPATLVTVTRCRQWWIGQEHTGCPSAWVSTAVPWRKRCWKNMGASRRKALWRARWIR